MTDTTTSARPAPGGTAPLAGRPVSRVGYGAMQLERHLADPDSGIAVLRRAIELGIDHIDTAHFYADGFVNSLIRSVMGDADLLVATKVGAVPDPNGPRPLKPAQKPAELRAGVEQNLRSLGVDSIPLVNLRRMEIGPGLAATGDQIVDVDDQLAEMISMRDEGKIGDIGLSAVVTETVRHALPAGIACVQNPYNLIDRRFEEMLNLCMANGVAWVPFFPLGSAFEAFPNVTDDATVQQVAADAGITPSQAGLAWLLSHAENMFIIPGTGSIGHLEENTAAGSIQLSRSAMEALDAVGADTVSIPVQPPVWPTEAP
jgi:pyridoxine 4-dehydrogenase